MESKSLLSFSCRVALLACLLPATLPGETKPAPAERHVVVVVWDGMRPDFVTEGNTPVLWKLAHDGVTFRNHHSVYPTATNVNGAAIATGVYPNRSSLLANREFRPQIKPLTIFENGEPSVITKGDEVTGGKYLALPTIAEIVRAAGRRNAIAGSKAVIFLHDRHAEWTSAVAKDGYTKFAVAPMPESLRNEMVRALGPLPTDAKITGDERNIYATRALTEVLWRDGLPAFSFLWMCEPDLAQHESAPGSDLSIAAIRNADRNLGMVVEAVTKKNARETTDILLVSDHGFSTIERDVDFVAALRAAGFDAFSTFNETPKAGQIMIAGNGGTILFYVIEHDRGVTARLVEWLQHSDFAGVIFAREKFEGVFSLEAVHANTTDAPDVIVAMRWNPKPNQFGTPGHIVTDSARGKNKGSHASLSEFDVHNTLIAAGPDFRHGLTSDLPSGNVDIAPTVLHLLGLETPGKFDGRVLSEAMNENSVAAKSTTHTTEAKRKFSEGRWRQHLRTSKVGGTTYFDEGNGAFELH
ncbi:MAG: alkaline phosphatase family protein [Verrucomicrobiota bacterium]|nr:alkaline phosphatase family protein [Verrucomicrobiota bacterium]